MKTKLLLLLLTLILAVSLAAQNRVDRVVLFEEFTNTYCGPCAGANPTIEEMLADYGDQAVSIWYHVSWPGSGDPFYQANTTESTARVTYYGVGAVPDSYVDGNLEPSPGNMSSMTSAVNQRLATTSPLQITAFYTDPGESCQITIDVTAVDAVATGDYRLHVVAIEDDLHHNAPNGETLFDHVMRKMYPNQNGTSIQFTTGETQHIVMDVPTDTEWVSENVKFVVFVQNNANKEVLQAHLAEQNVMPLPENFAVSQQNNSSIAITWQEPVAPTRDLTGFNIYRDEELLATVNPDVYSYIDTNVEVGFSYEYKMNAAYSDPLLPLSPFTDPLRMSPGSILAPTNLTCWPETINHIGMEWTAPVDNENVSGYSVYVDGNLMAITEANETTCEVEDLDAGTYQVQIKAFNYGIETDPSNIVNQPVVLQPVTNLRYMIPSTGVRVILQWDYPTTRSVTGYNVYRNGELVSFRTGNNFIDNDVAYGDGNVYEYYLRAQYSDSFLSEPSEVVTVNDFNTPTSDDVNQAGNMLLGNTPNPFNPETEISFKLAQPGMVNLTVYNILGQKVKTLVSQRMDAGVQNIVWNGTDENGKIQAGGVYFYKIRSGRFTSTKKMILLK